MVVDDSRAVRMILSRTLADLGYTVEQAANGHEGLVKMATGGETLKLVLVDWNMPEVNGLEFVRAVRARPEFDCVRIMMVTTETETEQMIRALEAGANEYLMKPFTPELVREKLSLMGIGT